MKLAFIFAAVMVCGSLAQAQTAPVQASRPAWPGCAWKPHQFEQLGVRLLYQDCTDPSSHYELSQKDNWLEQHRPADDVIFGSHRVVGVFHKPAEQSIEEAIQQAFVKRIVPLDNENEQARARKYCRVVPLKPSPLSDARKVALTIAPTGSYQRYIQRQMRQFPRDYGCGEYGMGQGLSYFEYHPYESKTRYLFVEYGMDESLLDENSLELIGPQ